MQNQQGVSNKPTEAYYLTLIGAILGIIVGFFLIFIFIGFWIIIANVLTIIFAQKLMGEPMEHSKWGTFIIVFAVLSGLNIISVIGGILAISYSPVPIQGSTQPYYYPQPPSIAITKYCSHCGAGVDQSALFCPRCGSQL